MESENNEIGNPVGDEKEQETDAKNVSDGEQRTESEEGENKQSEIETEKDQVEEIDAPCDNSRIENVEDENDVVDVDENTEQNDNNVNSVDDTGSTETKMVTTENGDNSENTNDLENTQNEFEENGIILDDSNERRIDTDDTEEDDDYFNPLLLCPDISMDVDESPVLTGSDLPQSNDSGDPNSLFAPLFSTFVDEMTGAEISFNLTAEEQQMREKLYGPTNPIQYTKIHCTACSVHLGSSLAGQSNRFVHPLLKVLICKECYHFYTSGEFEKDEDGSELYCRWCGQGGQVLCCTMCEFVFCKKCIRINFGRKKLTEVRDSDDWKCFRCDASQLKALRAMCVEFFEYIRKEKARASSYTDPDMVNKDLTTCCQSSSGRKRLVEAAEATTDGAATVKKRPRRRNEDTDPDYQPHRTTEDDDGSNSPVPTAAGASVPRPVPVPVKAPVVVNLPKGLPEVRYSAKVQASTIRIGNTLVNLKGLGGNVAQLGTTPTTIRNTAIRSSTSSNVRFRPTFAPRTSNSVRPVVAAAPSTFRAQKSQPVPAMKHEWFEKTVRAAARVNSNLSYTLTQLNKAQSSAGSVEQLAVVHNKLQEILSSSINSLIQIRKNLRTEFIAGIKTIRFPPKPAVDPNDDDVIIVNSEPSKQAVASSSKRVKTGSNPTNRASPAGSANAPRVYLKVKTFSQLQNVTSECITIPDDDPPTAPVTEDPDVVEINEDEPPEELVPSPEEVEDNVSSEPKNVSHKENEEDKQLEERTKSDDEQKEDGSDKEKENGSNKEKEDGSNKEKENGSNKEKEKENENGLPSSETEGEGKSSDEPEKCNGDVTVKTEPEEKSYNVKDKPTPTIRRMLSVKVNLKKSSGMEEMVKKEPIENGNE